MKYRVNLKKTDEGYSVWVPGLPGCWSQGKTEEQALENIKDAIQAYLETVEELSQNKESRYVKVRTLKSKDFISATPHSVRRHCLYE